MLHKGAQKRIYFDGATYFVTSNVDKRIEFFTEPIFCEVFMANLRLAKIFYKFDLYGFVVLLDHVHLLFFPNKAKDLSKIMQFSKRHTTRDINCVLGYDSLHNPEGAIRESLLLVRERLLMNKLAILKNNDIIDKKLDGKYESRRKLIENHYQSLKNFKYKFIKKYGENQNTFPKFKWQKSFRDHYMRDKKDFEEHIKYIHDNPFKHNIPNAEKYQYIFSNYPELINEP